MNSSSSCSEEGGVVGGMIPTTVGGVHRVRTLDVQVWVHVNNIRWPWRWYCNVCPIRISTFPRPRALEGEMKGKERCQLRTMISPKSNPFVSPPSFRTSTTNRPSGPRTFCPHTTHVASVDVDTDADAPPGIGSGTVTTPRVRACMAWSIRHVQ